MKEYYRNNKDITSIEGVLVDKGSLWEKKGYFMVLVDDDQYVSRETFPNDPYFHPD